MAQPALVLLVRFKSRLSFDEVMQIARERAPEFAALPGLVQKYYLEDVETGEIAGCYFWESPEALGEYRESELRASIAAAYQAETEPSVSVYRIAMALRD